ncbi:MAG: hypothetical protein ACJ760_13340 [Thermoleophilaceae bacterium]
MIDKMGLSDGTPPDGSHYHVAGEVDGGFRVVDVWESAERFQEFAEQQIGPLTQEEGFPPPEVSIREVHNTMSR